MKSLKLMYYFFEFFHTVFICIAVIALGAVGEEGNNMLLVFFTFAASCGAAAVTASLSWYASYLINEEEWRRGNEEKSKQGDSRQEDRGKSQGISG